jgi:hypothetical protein
MALPPRFNAFHSPIRASGIPVLEQFGLMFAGPVPQEHQRARRETFGQHLPMQIYYNFVFAMEGMKVRRRMVIDRLRVR